MKLLNSIATALPREVEDAYARFSPRKSPPFCTREALFAGLSILQKLYALPYKIFVKGYTSGLPAVDGCCQPSASQRGALPARNEALPAIDETLPATDALSRYTAIEHKQSKMKVFPRICLYCIPPYHLKTSKECHTWIQNHQSRNFIAWWPKIQVVQFR